MGSISIWHWVLVIVVFASPVMGILRGVQNGAPLHAVLSAFIPIYGLVYFFAANKQSVGAPTKLPHQPFS
ncbi:hypothetical protein [Bradyrhizobium septentrionale]|uniref:Uncharacterized protein n=1 Tax=Bradyrhizobium septentrionale TaxID=1404411 RepID=A0ABZ2NZQ0_9BRAD